MSGHIRVVGDGDCFRVERPYNHKEAYCLMQYQTEDGTEREILWNSRDGVTPFYIRLRSGREARHVNWEEDRCVPDYRPSVGSRIFVDMSEVRETAIMEQIFEMVESGTPDIVVVE